MKQMLRRSIFLLLLSLGLALVSMTALQAELPLVDDDISATLEDLNRYSTVEFDGNHTLTITGTGGSVRPVFVSPSVLSGATVQFGSGPPAATAPEWSLSNNSPRWSGIFDIDSGTLSVTSGSSNKYILGRWTDDVAGGIYGRVNVQGGSTLNIQSSTSMGHLTTSATASASAAIVSVASGSTLTVQNGITNANGFMTKTGAGTLAGLANGANAVFELGNLTVSEGTFTLSDGSAAINDARLTANELTITSGALLDIQRTSIVNVGTLNLHSGSTVSIRLDSSTDADGPQYTQYQAEVIQMGMDGNVTINIVSDNAAPAPESMTLFSAGTLITDLDEITVTDNILGKKYTAGLSDNALSLVVNASNSDQFGPKATTRNTRQMAGYLDRAIANNRYGSMYNVLSQLEANPNQLRQLTGEVYASSVAYQFTNNYLTIQHVNEQLRNIPLITYSGKASPRSTVPGVNTNTGGWDTAPYGPGYAPAYEGVQPYNTVPGGAVPSAGMIQRSIFDEGGNGLVRGQALGDPGTLIYSAWLSVMAGEGKTKGRADAYGYDTERYGALLGLDLFGSTDCRFGAFYSYQHNKLKEQLTHYGNAKIHSHLLGLYHQWGDEFIYNIITLRGGFDRYDTSRSVAYGTVSDSLSSKRDSYNAGIGYERGAHFQVCNALLLSPYAGVDYSYMHLDSFSESSSTNTGFALHGKKHNYHSLRSILGVTAAVRMYPGQQEFAILGRLNWTHEFLDYLDGRQTLSYSGFNPSAGTFDIYGNTLGRDWALAGIGVEWIPVPSLMAFLNWDYLKNKYISDNYWSVGARYRW